MYCSKCGSNINNNVKFCSKCGNSLPENSNYKTNNIFGGKSLKTKSILDKFLLFVTILGGLLLIYIFSNGVIHFPKPQLTEEMAIEKTNLLFLSVKNSDYDNIKSLLTTEYQLGMSGREEFLSEVEELHNMVLSYKAIDDVKFNLDYIPNSLINIDNKNATAQFDLAIQSNIDEVVSHFTGEKDDFMRVTIYFKYVKGKWLIDNMEGYEL